MFEAFFTWLTASSTVSTCLQKEGERSPKGRGLPKCLTRSFPQPNRSRVTNPQAVEIPPGSLLTPNPTTRPLDPSRSHRRLLSPSFRQGLTLANPTHFSPIPSSPLFHSKWLSTTKVLSTLLVNSLNFFFLFNHSSSPPAGAKHLQVGPCLKRFER